ncbi:hypothetical protein [Planctomycetes bacterium Poly30]
MRPLCVAAFALTCLGPAPESVPPPMFLPGADLQIERVYTWRETSATTSAEILLDGEKTQDVPTVTSELKSEASLSVVDTFFRSDVNRPLHLRRMFEDIAYESSGNLRLDMGAGVAELAISCDGDSELDGAAVEFLWDDDSEAYVKKFAEDYDGDDDLLEGLDPDGDFIALLPVPDRDIEVGSSWKVEASALRRVLLPGGRLPMERESDMDAVDGAFDPLVMPGVMETLDGDASGGMSVRLVSAEDGTMTLELLVEVEFVSDQAEAVGDMLGTVAPEDVDVELESATYTSTLEGKGTLVWDTLNHFARSFRLDLETGLDVQIAVHVEGMGIDAPFELKEKREGTLRLDMERL